MDCLVWQWIEGCTDVPNLHALMWELIAGAGIAFGIWFIQYRKTNRRKIHAEESIIEMSGEIRNTIRFFADELIHFNENKQEMLDLQKRIQEVVKKEVNQTQDLINTSFDVISNSNMDSLRHLKQLLEHGSFRKIGTGYLLMIENQVSFILIALNDRRKELIKKKRKDMNKFLKENIPADDKIRADALVKGTEMLISNISFIKNDPNEIHKKMANFPNSKFYDDP